MYLKAVKFNYLLQSQHKTYFLFNHTYLLCRIKMLQEDNNNYKYKYLLLVVAMLIQLSTFAKA